MTPFTVLEGIMAPMPVANVNTDSIIPSVWLRFANVDLGKGLFGALRYEPDGHERPGFILNRPPFRQSRILLADENFGCGSSREAAVWALEQFGIRCVLAPSFADIFYENAFRNGVLAGRIDPADLSAMLAEIGWHPDRPIFRVDLPTRSVTGPDGTRYRLDVAAARADALIRGEDEIATTLRLEQDIAAWYSTARAQRPWLYATATKEEAR